MRVRPGGNGSGRAGLTLIEITISVVIATGLVLGSASVFSQNMRAVERARGMSDAAAFLGTVMESVAAQPYESLLALSGTRVFESTDASDSAHAVDLTSFLVEVGLIQVQAELVELPSGRVVGGTTLQRSSR